MLRGLLRLAEALQDMSGKALVIGVGAGRRLGMLENAPSRGVIVTLGVQARQAHRPADLRRQNFKPFGQHLHRRFGLPGSQLQAHEQLPGQRMEGVQAQGLAQLLSPLIEPPLVDRRDRLTIVGLSAFAC